LPVKIVVDTTVDGGANAGGDLAELDPAVTGTALVGNGRMTGSGELDGLDKVAAIAATIERMEAAGTGRAAKNFRLRDWLISRQRFWGTPIPMLHLQDGSVVPVAEDRLPVTLPSVEGLDLRPKGTSPLGAAESWVRTVDSASGEPALRDTDTMDTFVDSSWYFLRFLSPNSDRFAFDPDEAKRWAPVDGYFGGVEHAILHLLYARFITKVLFDLGLVDFEEPFSNLVNQGMVIMDGAKMSKSKGNLVELSDLLEQYGADALRLSLAFAGPVEDDKEWNGVSISGAHKFLARALRLGEDTTSPAGADATAGDAGLRRITHRLLADAPGLLEQTKFNVLVARLMELVNGIRKTIDAGTGAADPAVREAAETVALMLEPITPHTAEELWERLGHEPSV